MMDIDNLEAFPPTEWEKKPSAERNRIAEAMNKFSRSLRIDVQTSFNPYTGKWGYERHVRNVRHIWSNKGLSTKHSVSGFESEEDAMQGAMDELTLEVDSYV